MEREREGAKGHGSGSGVDPTMERTTVKDGGLAEEGEMSIGLVVKFHLSVLRQ